MDTTRSANGQRQTATLHYEISTEWETKPRTTPLEASRMLMGPEQVTRSKTLQALSFSSSPSSHSSSSSQTMTRQF